MGCFLCVAFSAFLGDASRGLVVPSIVPFIYTVGSEIFTDQPITWCADRGRQRLCGLGERRVFRRALGGSPSFWLLGREAEFSRSDLREHGPVRCGYVTTCLERGGGDDRRGRRQQVINTRKCAVRASNIRMADLGVTDVGRSWVW